MQPMIWIISQTNEQEWDSAGSLILPHKDTTHNSKAYSHCICNEVGQNADTTPTRHKRATETRSIKADSNFPLELATEEYLVMTIILLTTEQLSNFYAEQFVYIYFSAAVWLGQNRRHEQNGPAECLLLAWQNNLTGEFGICCCVGLVSRRLSVSTIHSFFVVICIR